LSKIAHIIRLLLLAICLTCSLSLAAQNETTKRTAAKMLAELTTKGEEVVMDREITVRSEYSDITFSPSASAKGYVVVLVYPNPAPSFSQPDGYANYEGQSRQVPFKANAMSKTAYLLLRVPSVPGKTVHLHFKVDPYLGSSLSRLMVVAHN
jgi:hypothetical protein